MWLVAMSQVAEHKTKKRKHAAAATAADATTSVAEPSPKRSKTDKVKKDKSKSKLRGDVSRGKGKAAVAGQFRVVHASLPLSIPPAFANNLRAGAEEMLDSMLMRCARICTYYILHLHNNIVPYVKIYPRLGRCCARTPQNAFPRTKSHNQGGLPIRKLSC